jgi:hypothetical protein
VTATGAGIIVDEAKLPGCLNTAQDFLDTQNLGLKRSLPAAMLVCNIALVASDFAWRRGKLDGDIFFVWAGYIIFGVITLVLHIIDALVGVGKEFGCNDCSINSGLGYYNYHVQVLVRGTRFRTHFNLNSKVRGHLSLLVTIGLLYNLVNKDLL